LLPNLTGAGLFLIDQSGRRQVMRRPCEQPYCQLSRNNRICMLGSKVLSAFMQRRE
jgi:hypothetical protein